MNCAIYARVSTADGRQDTENQLLQLQAFAAQQSWSVFKVYRDNASGKSSDRDSYKLMIADAEKRRFNCLLFWSLDRLSREGVLPTLHLLNRLTEWGIGYRSYSEQYLDSCGIFKDAVISILATVAKQERIRLSERTKAGLARQQLTGKPGPHGLLGPGRPKVVVDLARARDMRNVEQLSYAKIAKHFGVSKATMFTLLNDRDQKSEVRAQGQSGAA